MNKVPVVQITNKHFIKSQSTLETKWPFLVKFRNLITKSFHKKILKRIFRHYNSRIKILLRQIFLILLNRQQIVVVQICWCTNIILQLILEKVFTTPKLIRCIRNFKWWEQNRNKKLTIWKVKEVITIFLSRN